MRKPENKSLQYLTALQPILASKNAAIQRNQDAADELAAKRAALNAISRRLASEADCDKLIGLSQERRSMRDSIEDLEIVVRAGAAVDCSAQLAAMGSLPAEAEAEYAAFCDECKEQIALIKADSDRQIAAIFSQLENHMYMRARSVRAQLGL